jgi:hypothetical protein
VDYSVDVENQAPNNFFVQEPTDDVLVAALADEGLDACVTDCAPQRCSSFHLSGFLQDSELPQVKKAIIEAYVAANPGVEASSLSVNITNVDNSLQDSTG